eukprot:2524052-Rhodomonas_salina.1
MGVGRPYTSLDVSHTPTAHRVYRAHTHRVCRVHAVHAHRVCRVHAVLATSVLTKSTIVTTWSGNGVAESGDGGGQHEQGSAAS